jgi:uncharacterized protein VirK/YbjX
VGQVLHVLGNPVRHFRLAGNISAGGFSFVNRIFPNTCCKYLGQYLSRHLDRRQRWDALRHHYDFLEERLDAERAFSLSFRDEPLFKWEAEGAFELRLGIARLTKFEGEFVLSLVRDGVALSLMTFAIVPGAVVALDEPNVIFIGGSQGATGQFQAIRTTTKSNHDVCPQAMLLTGVQAIAARLGIAAIVAVGAENQVCVGKKVAPLYHRSIYDELWLAAGGVRLPAGNYLIPAAPAEKPLSLIKVGHRARTRRKRQFKRMLFSTVQIGFAPLVAGPLPVSLRQPAFEPS